MSEEQEILNDAADILERDGWCQGEFHSAEGAHCALGAISEAYMSFDYRRELYGATKSLLAERIGTPWIATWNDHGDRTKEQVVKAMRGTL